ncbi:hypothetical protein HUG15_09310 [Salicibibacter cibarius]|uniref:Aminotransferase class I/II-fold pyridoxal phosphate-dependent enzyme n=1 Tax=Salicibibacter cibarius TaxID=2743000 RepID=A0A7T6Z2G7_9BACI|nr:hypothetical protein [Salicibibacter cibarius]QQK75744.1 hypothetical protein HUG15_09310 [Salicibibacter cibarius]
MSKYYKELREKLIAAIQQHFGSRVQVEGEKAGLHFLLHLDTEEPIEAIMERAEKMDLELYSIQRFMQKASGSIPATLIIGFAKLKPEEIDEAVEALCRCCFPVS